MKKMVKVSKVKKANSRDISSERDIAVDFAMKVYRRFDKMIKSVVLFGSTAKKVSEPDSDIDIIIIIDDCSIKWDSELIAWYREELGKIIRANPYKKPLHVNTVKLSTWWADLIRGDPVVTNIIRWGEPILDFGGFFMPLKVLLQEGKIRSTPESIYTLLQRAPIHLSRTRASLLAAIDGLYWAMVDSAQAALIAAKADPTSPEHIPAILYETFVNKKMLDRRYVEDYRNLHIIAKDIVHGKVVDVRGSEIDNWILKADAFVTEMAKIIDAVTEKHN